jgi:predicted RNA-binding protein with PIN domain
MGQTESVTTVIVDGNNVIGTVPDGWWRDLPAAARRLLGRLACYRRRSGNRIVLVLDAAQPDLSEGHKDGIEIRYPARSGRDAADERIVDLVDDLDGRDGGDVAVVSSDQALAVAVTARGADVIGARTFLARLDDMGC